MVMLGLEDDEEEAEADERRVERRVPVNRLVMDDGRVSVWTQETRFNYMRLAE